ncbi:hypothetical protein JXA40_01975 [bacterium]|nr:hypothetical protein [candidate division CSSED10-310 bacterium]
MKAFIILVSNGPTVVVTRLDAEKTVSNLIWRGFRDFNLYEISEDKLGDLRKDIGERTWDNTLEELNNEWPVRVVDRDSSRAFHNFQTFARDVPVAKIRDRKKLAVLN